MWHANMDIDMVADMDVDMVDDVADDRPCFNGPV
jgi:hypothetical protein